MLIQELLEMAEMPNSFKVGAIFKSADKKGDFSGEVMKILAGPKELNGITMWQIGFDDGFSDWYGYDELNVDIASIRDPDYDIDHDFHGDLM